MATSRSGEQPPPAWRALLRVWPWLCAGLSGWMLALCFPDWDQAWLCWLGLCPLIAAIWFSPAPARRWRRGLRNALLGYAFGVVFFTATFWWLGALSELYQNAWLRLLPVLLALYLSLYTAFWGWFAGLLPNTFSEGDTKFLSSGRNIVIALVGASAWVVQEWLRGFVLGGFGWNGLGVALHRNFALMQIADVCGVYGLSFLVAFVNLIALITIRRFVSEVGRTRIRPHWDFSVMMASVVGIFAYGIHALFHPVEARGATTLRVAAIQPAIPEQEKAGAYSDPAREAAILDEYKQRTELALVLKPQLILWPEAATPHDLFYPATYDFLKKVAAETDANFLTGSFLATPSDGEYNIAAFFTRGGNSVQIYRKVHLVPFGEYVPLRDTFPLFARIAGDLVPGDLSFGKDYTVFRTDDPPLRAGPLICFEDTLGDLARQFVARGADVLVNITNDGWFNHTPGPEQHLANSVFRSVENRRPLLRDANTGVTCFIDAEGRVIDSLLDEKGTPFTEGELSASIRIPRDAPITFYTRYGDWIVLVSAGVSSMYLLLCCKRKARP